MPKSASSPEQAPAPLDPHQVSLVEQIHHNQMRTNQILTEILQNQRKIEMKQNEHDKYICQSLVAGHHHALKKPQAKKQQIQIIIQDPAGNSPVRHSVLSQSADDPSPNRLVFPKLPLGARAYDFAGASITPMAAQSTAQEQARQPQLIVQGPRIPIASPGKRLEFTAMQQAQHSLRTATNQGKASRRAGALSPQKTDYPMLTPLN